MLDEASEIHENRLAVDELACENANGWGQLGASYTRILEEHGRM